MSPGRAGFQSRRWDTRPTETLFHSPFVHRQFTEAMRLNITVRTLNTLVMIAIVGASRADAVDFEIPPEEPAAASLAAELAAGPDFHVSEPVLSYGLMHHYV